MLNIIRLDNTISNIFRIRGDPIEVANHIRIHARTLGRTSNAVTDDSDIVS